MVHEDLMDGITITTPILITVVTALAGTIGLMFKLLMSSHAKALADQDSIKRSYQEMAVEAIKSAKETADFYRQKYESKAPIILAAPVISESHSASTKFQREAAQIATMRASLAAIKLAMSQSPRKEPEQGQE